MKTSTALVLAGAVGVAIFYLEKKTSTPTVAPVPPVANKPVTITADAGTILGATFAKWTGPLAPIAVPIAASEGHSIESGLKQTLRGDKEIATGHFVQGFKDVGAGYYHAATDTAVSLYNDTLGKIL